MKFQDGSYFDPRILKTDPKISVNAIRSKVSAKSKNTFSIENGRNDVKKKLFALNCAPKVLMTKKL